VCDVGWKPDNPPHIRTKEGQAPGVMLSVRRQGLCSASMTGTGVIIDGS
jgi:hypothetical protein